MTKFRLVAAGQAPRTVQSEVDVNLSDVVSQFNLYAFDLKLNGESVAREAYATTPVPDGASIWGTVPVKGA